MWDTQILTLPAQGAGSTEADNRKFLPCGGTQAVYVSVCPQVQGLLQQTFFLSVDKSGR